MNDQEMSATPPTIPGASFFPSTEMAILAMLLKAKPSLAV